MKPLASQKCVPCEGGVPRLSENEIKSGLKKLKGWEYSRKKRLIRREMKLKDFMAAVGLIRKIAVVAEKENHHPDLHLTGYRKLAVELSTHAIKGLSQNDFILAAKIDRLAPKK